MDLQKLLLKNPKLVKYTLENINPSLLVDLGKKKAFKAFQIASKVKAYQELIEEKGVQISSIQSEEDFRKLPIIDKQSYILKYPLGKLLKVDFAQNYTIEESSGYGGKSCFWLRYSGQDDAFVNYAEVGLVKTYNVKKKSTLVINTFALGTWVTGVKFARALCGVANKKDIKMTVANTGMVFDSAIKTIQNFADENIKREIVLLETMLSATKIDNAKLELKLEKVDMLDVIHDTLLAEESKAKEKGLQIKTELPSECFIFVDRVRIQEVVDNLINNAVKYTNEGSVKIILEENHDFALLSIIDTGIGISAQDLKNLGKKFYRANNYLEKSEKADFHVVRPGGTGLGLYVTFELVTAMGGKIVVASSLGKGTRFTVYLPKYKTQEPQILKISEPEGPNKVLIEEFVSKD